MKIKVLFVCLGNICRSPSAEAVFKNFVDQRGDSDKFFIDSAGTSAYHEGEPADSRMRGHARRRDIELTSISRQFDKKDFDRFDYIVAMDKDNLRDLERQARNKKDLGKIYLMTDFSNNYNYNQVPDPYYGGPEGFELVLDLLEDSSEGFYNYVLKQ